MNSCIFIQNFGGLKFKCPFYVNNDSVFLFDNQTIQRWESVSSRPCYVDLVGLDFFPTQLDMNKNLFDQIIFATVGVQFEAGMRFVLFLELYTIYYLNLLLFKMGMYSIMYSITPIHQCFDINSSSFKLKLIRKL